MILHHFHSACCPVGIAGPSSLVLKRISVIKIRNRAAFSNATRGYFFGIMNFANKHLHLLIRFSFVKVTSSFGGYFCYYRSRVQRSQLSFLEFKAFSEFVFYSYHQTTLSWLIAIQAVLFWGATARHQQQYLLPTVLALK
jgi:hypothetical protein